MRADEFQPPESPADGTNSSEVCLTLKSLEPLVVSMPKISGHGIAATILTCPENCYIVCSSYNIYIICICI